MPAGGRPAARAQSCRGWLLPAPAGYGHHPHRPTIPEKAPPRTTQLPRLTQRRAPARRTPNTGIDLLDTDAFNERPVRRCCLELDRFHPASIQAGHFDAIAIPAHGLFAKGELEGIADNPQCGGATNRQSAVGQLILA